MLDANTQAFWDRYPNGATVRDRLGRVITNMMACNPETGEVVMWSQAWSPRHWLFGLLSRPRPAWVQNYSSCIPRRHGFWPAPLTIEPRCPDAAA